MSQHFDGQPIDEDVGEAIPDVRKGTLRRGFGLLRHIFPYLRPRIWLAVGVIVSTVLLAVATLAQPWPIAFVVDGVVGAEDDVPGWIASIFGTDTGRLIWVGAISMLLVTAAAGALEVVLQYFSVRLEQQVVLDFRSDLFRHAHRLSFSYHDESRTGMLMYRINNQARQVGQVLLALPTLAQSVLTLVGMFIVTYTIDAQLALLAVAIVPFIYYSVNYYADRIDPELRRVRGLEGTGLAIVHEAMAMIRVVVAFGQEQHEYGKFRAQGEKAINARIHVTLKQTLFRLCVNLITAAGTAAVLYVGANRVISNDISAGELMVIITYIARTYEPLERLSTMMTNLQQHFIAVDHAITLLNEPIGIEERDDARPMERSSGRLEVRNLSFDYPTRPEVLADVSFTAEPGETVAIVGPTGAGKSTLINLLPRFYDPTHGAVLLDGVDLRDLTIASVRSQFSIVMQEPLLSSESIKKNILYGNPDASEDAVRQAARAANAHDFITALPKKYTTTLGERGAMLSGGERQRISIARAFLRDAPVLILDEPTSAIDSRTEQVILDAMNRLMAGRTTILIAHRLATVRRADKIIVMDHGRVVQQGTFDELRDQEGLFNLLWDAQTGTDEPPALGAAENGEVGATPTGQGGAVAALPAATNGNGVARSPWPPPVGSSSITELAPPIAGPAPSAAAGTAPAIRSRPKIVLLGLLTKLPYPGPAWLVQQFATGFEQLGCDVYYVEDHGRAPTEFVARRHDGTAAAADYLAATFSELGFDGRRWAYRPSRESDRVYGMDVSELEDLYAGAALIVNMYGGTDPSDEQAESGRLVYLGTDPAEIERRLAAGDTQLRELLDKHAALFTWATNLGQSDFGPVQLSDLPFIATRPPVVTNAWMHERTEQRGFTTVGNWRLREHPMAGDDPDGRRTMREAFEPLIELPSVAVPATFKLALANLDRADRQRLTAAHWSLGVPDRVAGDLDSYRRFIQRSQGELAVASPANVELRTGWISERSAFYLAAGRPVVSQDTGLGRLVPVGEGLHVFTDLSSAVAAIDRVLADPQRERVAAFGMAVELFRADYVLAAMLDAVGFEVKRTSQPLVGPPPPRIPADLDLTPASRRPLQFSDVTQQWVSSRPAPGVSRPSVGPPSTSIVIPVWNALECTKLCIDSVLANTHRGRGYELIIIDNGSDHATHSYLAALAARNAHVRLLRQDRNEGFAAGVNRGVASSRGEYIVVLNSDTMVPPGWLRPLLLALDRDDVGLVGPRTNRCGNEAEIPTGYRTYQEMIDEVAAMAASTGELWDLDVTVMFCVAFRKSVYDEVGGLDEQFEIGMFEDDDYARRVRATGRRVVCAEDAFVHHMGEASLGDLAPSGELGELFDRNRARFEAKWSVTWTPHERRPNADYHVLRTRLRSAVSENVPEGSTVLLVSRGDDALLQLDGRVGWHFPRDESGSWPGHYPSDSEDALGQLATAQRAGAGYLVLPDPSRWWLERYEELGVQLVDHHELLADIDGVGAIYRLMDR